MDWTDTVLAVLSALGAASAAAVAAVPAVPVGGVGSVNTIAGPAMLSCVSAATIPVQQTSPHVARWMLGLLMRMTWLWGATAA